MLSKRLRDDGVSVLRLNSLQKEVKAAFEANIDNGTYAFDNRPCCVCEKTDFESLAEKDRYGLYCPTVICKNCGLILQNPMMQQHAYNHFYENDYRKLYLGKGAATNCFFKTQYVHGKKIYQYLSNSLNIDITDLKVLEVGTGAGGILQYFKEQGNTVFGIDLDRDYVEFGKKTYGLDLTFGALITTDLPWVPDIVIYSHVIEHLLDPVQELIQLDSVINEDTFVYIETPGVKNLSHSYGADFLKLLQNAHTYYFTLTTMQNILRKANYEFVCGDEFIHSVFKPSQIKSTEKLELENDYNAARLFLRKMEWYRFSPTLHNIIFKLHNQL